MVVSNGETQFGLETFSWDLPRLNQHEATACLDQFEKLLQLSNRSGSDLVAALLALVVQRLSVPSWCKDGLICIGWFGLVIGGWWWCSS